MQIYVRFSCFRAGLSWKNFFFGGFLFRLRCRFAPACWSLLSLRFCLYSKIFPAGIIPLLVVADFGRFETKNDNSARKKSSPKAAITLRVQLYFSYINIICLFTTIYKIS